LVEKKTIHRQNSLREQGEKFKKSRKKMGKEEESRKVKTLTSGSSSWVCDGSNAKKRGTTSLFREGRGNVTKGEMDRRFVGSKKGSRKAPKKEPPR